MQTDTSKEKIATVTGVWYGDGRKAVFGVFVLR